MIRLWVCTSLALSACAGTPPNLPERGGGVLNERALRDGWIGLSVSPELYRLEQRLLEQEQRMRKERP